MLTSTQKLVAESIVNIFETAAVRGQYGDVTVIPRDNGHLTYGRSQTTLATGNLHLLIDGYCAQPGARFASRLRPYLDKLKANNIALDVDFQLHNLLRASADDIVMRDVQDAFFDEHYWQPAARQAAAMGIVSALGTAVVYDSVVHGSWEPRRDATNKDAGTLDKLSERGWIAAYVKLRREWLATSQPVLRPTVYRMEAFQSLIDNHQWDLAMPLLVRQQEISEYTLALPPPGCYSGPQPGSRPLTVSAPLLRGLDVRLLQLGLSMKGVPIKADGVFGATTSGLLRQYQSDSGVPATGVADIALIAALTA